MYFGLQCRVREIFRKFDCNRDGWLPVKEFKAALEHMHLVTSEEETLRIIATVASTGSEEVEYEKYMDLVLNKHSLGRNSREECNNNVLIAAPWERVNGDFVKCLTSAAATHPPVGNSCDDANLGEVCLQNPATIRATGERVH